MAISDRKLREKSEMRSRILETAKQLYVEDGIQNVSIRKIAERIEYSPATIYLYFLDKDSILFALHDEGFRALFTRQRDVARLKDPAERLRKFLETYIEFALDSPEYYDLMFILFTPVPKFLKTAEWRYGRRAFQMLKATVMECQEKGYLAKFDPDAASLGIWGGVHGIASLLIRKRITMLPEVELPRLAREAVAMYEEALLGKSGARQRTLIK
ncbi:TetR/AcrR family transcriptional regulator [bacterium]|nr:TetR/AcrR family transcriptional regulator [bacterium]